MSQYKPISPWRVMDTRDGFGGVRLPAQTTVSLEVTTPDVVSAAGVTAAAVTAVVINVTAVDAAGPGFVTVWPQGSAQPATSSLNTTHAGHTVANLVTVPVGPGGRVSMFSLTGSDLVVDVQGVYVPAEVGGRSGRYFSGGHRVMDTRLRFGLPIGQPFKAGETRDLFPEWDSTNPMAAALVLNVTTTQTHGAGFFTLWPAGQPRPTASNLNVQAAGQTVANQVIVPVSNGGGWNENVSVFSSGGGHLVVDVVGLITNEDVAIGTDGYFVPVFPHRLVDTRESAAPTGGVRPAAGGVVEVQSAGAPGVPALGGVSALALNVTLTEASGPGFVTVWPARTGRPLASSVNAQGAGHTASNHVVTAITNAGFSLYTLEGAHLVADITGYWTGPAEYETDVYPSPPPFGGHPPVQPAQPPAYGPHSFLYKIWGGQDFNTVVGYKRWDPCRQIRYLLNGERGSPEQLVILASVIAELEAATGLDLVEVGRTAGGLDTRLGVPPNSVSAEAVIALSDADSSPVFASGGWFEAVGFGGGVDDGTKVISGFALVDVAVGDGDLFRSVLLHELAHMLGLDHVDDATQVMNPQTNYVQPVTRLAAGDLEGLWRVGAAQGCIQASA